EYQRAQERLQQVRAGTQTASAALDAQRGNSGAAQSAATLPETIVPVRATAPGTLRVVSVRAGQQVRAGQPLATVSTAQR
ncbi:MAG: biotin/lipoyl-binding protein, partial [Pyrinomonadaceae bacterium]|nr:biotin/lipoyl-binding protein [Pyrinomonadaceae bacterium]